MKFGTLISYKLNKLPLPKRCKIYRALNGWKDKSQYSKYSYNRTGVLSDVPHIFVNRCVLIVRKDYVDEIISFLNENNVEVFTRDVILTESDIEKLSKWT